VKLVVGASISPKSLALAFLSIIRVQVILISLVVVKFERELLSSLAKYYLALKGR